MNLTILNKIRKKPMNYQEKQIKFNLFKKKKRNLHNK